GQQEQGADDRLDGGGDVGTFGRVAPGIDQVAVPHHAPPAADQVAQGVEFGPRQADLLGPADGPRRPRVGGRPPSRGAHAQGGRARAPARPRRGGRPGPPGPCAGSTWSLPFRLAPGTGGGQGGRCYAGSVRGTPWGRTFRTVSSRVTWKIS